MKKILFLFSGGRINCFVVFISAFSILCGGLIYLFLRPSEYIFFKWFDFGDSGIWIETVRQQTKHFINFLPDWFIYSLPNGLWAFAYTLIITQIWEGSKSKLKYFWYSTIPIVIFGFEFFQLFGILPGTFSALDLIFALSGIGTGIFIRLKFIKPKYHETEIK